MIDSPFNGGSFLVIVPGFDQEKWDWVFWTDVAVKLSESILKCLSAATVYLSVGSPLSL